MTTATGDNRPAQPLMRLRRILTRLFDSDEFPVPFGIRSLSAAAQATVTAQVGGQHVSIEYEPGESRTGMFGGNSNWRGPIWFPVNVLLADPRRLSQSGLSPLRQPIDDRGTRPGALIKTPGFRRNCLDRRVFDQRTRWVPRGIARCR